MILYKNASSHWGTWAYLHTKFLSILVQRYTYLIIKVNLNTYYIILFEYDQIHKALEYT